MSVAVLKTEPMLMEPGMDEAIGMFIILIFFEDDGEPQAADRQRER
jgi:hypothetical protein